MQALIEVSLPVFGIMLAGYLCGRFKLVGQDSTAALNGYVYFVALPALFVIATARAPFERILDGPFLLAFLGAQVGILVFAAVIARVMFTERLGEAGMHGSCACFSNTGYMGIPLLITAFGPEGAVPAILLSLCTAVVTFTITITILEVEKGRAVPEGEVPPGIGTIIIRSVFNAFTTPLVGSAAIGVLLSLLQVDIPTPVGTFLDLLGNTAGPCALFAMGLFLVNQSVTRGALEVSWVTAVKLLLHPSLAWWLSAVWLELPREQVGYIVIMSALPTGSLMFLLGERYGVYVQRSAATILISTIVSVATVSAVLELYLR